MKHANEVEDAVYDQVNEPVVIKEEDEKEGQLPLESGYEDEDIVSDFEDANE